MPASDQSISVILPVFHRVSSVENLSLLRRALESIKDQRINGDYEVLVIDDGSPVPVQESSPLLGHVTDKVKWLRLERNGGLVNALNKGIIAAKYPLIARLDADDTWLPNKIDRQMALFAGDPDLTITATGMSLVRHDNTQIETHIRPGDWSGILRFFVEIGCPFPHGSVVAQKSVYALLGGYPHDGRFSHCEDYALWGTWLRFFKPAMIEEVLYNYTVSENSVSFIHADQQRSASHLVNRRFANGDLPNKLPSALNGLADALQISLFNAGKLAYLLWHFRPCVTLPVEAVEALRTVLFDRELSETSPAGSTQWFELLEISRPLPLQTTREITGRFYAL
jgi:glycosyltransferase involved in cell wall biosynthesis